MTPDQQRDAAISVARSALDSIELTDVAEMAPATVPSAELEEIHRLAQNAIVVLRDDKPPTATLSDEQRRALVGTEDSPGLLDQYKVHAMETQTGKHLVVWLCPRQHAGAESSGHLNVIARNLDGDQSGLTLGELVEAALDHEAENHS